MGKVSIIDAALLGAGIAFALPFENAALAQDGDTPGGAQISFGLSQRFETDSNIGLDVTSPGNTALATTQLSFGLKSQTRDQSLSLDMSSALRVISAPGAATETKLDDPNLTLAYSRQGAGSALSFGANYRRSDVQFLRPLDDFINDQGQIELPEDLSELTGTGLRTAYGLDATLELGQGAPLGFTLDAGLSGLDYQDTSSADLFDSRRSSLGATARLSLSAVTDVTLGLTRATYDAEDALSTGRVTSSLDFGLTHALPSGAELEAGLGYTIVTTDQTGLAEAKTEGVTGHLGLSYDLANGSASAELATTVNQDGTRTNLDFGRSLDLPGGALSASLGLTRSDSTDQTDVTAGLSYSQDLARGAFTASLRRGITTDSDDQEELTTALTLGLSQELSPVAHLGLSLSYAASDPTGAGNAVDQASFGATYSRALTTDWALDLGYNYRMRNEQTVGDADSHSVFLVLSRDFNLRP